MSERDLVILRGAVKGMNRGALAGGVAAVVTGAAALTLPVVPGAAVIGLATVARWSAAGSVVGGIAGAAAAWRKHRKMDREFAAVFGTLAAA